MIDPFGNRPWPEPYVHPRQAQQRPPTAYENLLADALEAAFAAGAWDLPAVAERLNADGVRTPDGQAWTASGLETELKRLGG